MNDPYHTLPAAPTTISAGTAISRLIDGIGFRYGWATQGLTDADLTFCPAPGSRNMGDLLKHIHGLLRWVGFGAGLQADEGPMPSPEGISIRDNTLHLARELSQRFADMPDDALDKFAIRTQDGSSHPFWNLLNGPLADSLTHIGQVASWRRILGKPVPRADVFRGRPPVQ